MNPRSLIFLLVMVEFVYICRGRLLTSDFDSGSADFLPEIPEIIRDILKDVGTFHGSIAFITDGTTSYDTVQKISEKLDGSFSIGVFNIQNSLGMAYNAASSSDLLEQLQMIQTTTDNLIIATASNSYPFIEGVFEKLYGSRLLRWQSRFLIFTGLEGDLSSLGRTLSEINLMVVRCTKRHFTRCGIVSYLPYSLKALNLASWSPGQGIMYGTKYPLFPEKFNRFIDRGHLYVTGEDYFPFLRVIDLPGITDDGKPNFTFRGPMRTILDIFARDMNFTFTLRRPPDGSWGYVLDNGTVFGMVGQLARKEADIFLGPLSMIPNRAQVIDFSITIRFNNMAFMAGVGDSEVNSWAFAVPLTVPVWGALLTSLVVVMLFTVGLSTFAEESLQDKAFPYISVLLQQDVAFPKFKSWERWLIGGWAISVTIIVLGYKGNLITPLAIRYITRSYRTISDVLDNPSITMMWKPNTNHVLAFRTAESGELARVHEAEKDGRIMYVSSDEDFQHLLSTLVKRGDHVLFLGEMTLLLLMASEFSTTGTCDYYIRSEILRPSLDVIGVQKYSPLQTPLNRRLSSLIESGIFTYILQNAVQNASTCYNAPSTQIVQSSFSMKNVWGIFMILVIGDSISLLLLCLETTMHKIGKFM